MVKEVLEEAGLNPIGISRTARYNAEVRSLPPGVPYVGPCCVMLPLMDDGQ